MNLRTVALLGNVLKKVPASGVPFPILLSFLNRRQEKSYLRKEFESKTKFVVRYAVIDVSTRHSLQLTGYWPFYSDWSWRWLEHEQNGHTFRNCCRCRTFVSSKKRCRSWPQKDTRLATIPSKPSVRNEDWQEGFTKLRENVVFTFLKWLGGFRSEIITSNGLLKWVEQRGQSTGNWSNFTEPQSTQNMWPHDVIQASSINFLEHFSTLHLRENSLGRESILSRLKRLRRNGVGWSTFDLLWNVR